MKGDTGVKELIVETHSRVSPTLTTYLMTWE